MSRRLSAIARTLALAALVAGACAPGSGQATSPAPAAASPTPTADARAAVADFYRGQVVTIVVGFAPGGGFDTTARILARHLPKHIPGNPTVIVQNMEGAGSLVAANHLYNVAKPDGRTLGLFHETQVINQLTGKEGVQFDARKFAWLGGSFKTVVTCLLREDTPFRTWRDVVSSQKPAIFGSTGPGSNTDETPKILRAATGANVRVIAGYKGSAEIRNAVERGEVDGMCLSWDSIRATAPDWAQGKVVRNLVQVGLAKSRELPDVPLAEEFATSEEGKLLLRVLATPQQMAKSFAAPPGTPPERVEALRTAFAAAYKDPELLEDAKKSKIEIEPLTGEEVERVVNDLLKTPPDVAKKFLDALK